MQISEKPRPPSLPIVLVAYKYPINIDYLVRCPFWQGHYLAWKQSSLMLSSFPKSDVVEPVRCGRGSTRRYTCCMKPMKKKSDRSARCIALALKHYGLELDYDDESLQQLVSLAEKVRSDPDADLREWASLLSWFLCTWLSMLSGGRIEETD